MSLKRIWKGTDRVSGIGEAQAKIDGATGITSGNAVIAEKISGIAVKSMVTAGRIIMNDAGTGLPTERIPRTIGGTGVTVARILVVGAGTDPLTAEITSISRTTGASTADIFRVIGNIANNIAGDISRGTSRCGLIISGTTVPITAIIGTISAIILRGQVPDIVPLRNPTAKGIRVGLTNVEFIGASHGSNN